MEIEEQLQLYETARRLKAVLPSLDVLLLFKTESTTDNEDVRRRRNSGRAPGQATGAESVSISTVIGRRPGSSIFLALRVRAPRSLQRRL